MGRIDRKRRQIERLLNESFAHVRRVGNSYQVAWSGGTCDVGISFLASGKRYQLILLKHLLTGVAATSRTYRYVLTDLPDLAIGNVVVMDNGNGTVDLTLVHGLLDTYLSPSELTRSAVAFSAVARGLSGQLQREVGGKFVVVI